MRKVLSVLLAVLLLAVPVTASADSEITVNGTGETLVSADMAVISLGVNARDKDVLKAQAKVNEAIASIRTALIENGVAEEDINTDYINIYAMYDYANGSEELTAYNANSNLAIRVLKKEAVGQLIDIAFEAGANTLNGITFSATDTSSAKANSLKLAFEDAKAKAEILAEAAGLHIIGIENIREGNSYSYDSGIANFSRQEVMDAKAVGGTVVQAAKISVTASVTVTFDVRDLAGICQQVFLRLCLGEVIAFCGEIRLDFRLCAGRAHNDRRTVFQTVDEHICLRQAGGCGIVAVRNIRDGNAGEVLRCVFTQILHNSGHLVHTGKARELKGIHLVEITAVLGVNLFHPLLDGGSDAAVVSSHLTDQHGGNHGVLVTHIRPG